MLLANHICWFNYTQLRVFFSNTRGCKTNLSDQFFERLVAVLVNLRMAHSFEFRSVANKSTTTLLSHVSDPLGTSHPLKVFVPIRLSPPPTLPATNFLNFSYDLTKFVKEKIKKTSRNNKKFSFRFRFLFNVSKVLLHFNLFCRKKRMHFPFTLDDEFYSSSNWIYMKGLRRTCWGGTQQEDGRFCQRKLLQAADKNI